MRKLAILALALFALTGCSRDMTNVVTKVKIAKGDAACPTEVWVTTIRNEIYYYQNGWFRNCGPTSQDLIGLPVEVWSQGKGGTGYWLHRYNKEWIQVYWWKYAT